MAKSKTRELSAVELDYIKEQCSKTNFKIADLYDKLQGVVTKAAIDKAIEECLPKSVPNQTAVERQQALSKVPGSSSKFMGRDPERGIAIMTEASSELSDARKVLAVPSADTIARQQTDRIHIIDPKKKAR